MSEITDTQLELTEELKARQTQQADITELVYTMYVGSLCLIALFLLFVLYMVIKLVH